MRSTSEPVRDHAFDRRACGVDKPGVLFQVRFATKHRSLKKHFLKVVFFFLVIIVIVKVTPHGIPLSTQPCDLGSLN